MGFHRLLCQLPGTVRSRFDVVSKGELAYITNRKSLSNNSNKSTLRLTGDPSTNVPGAKPESRAQRHGSALVCYQGHAPSTPVWSASIAPCSYYYSQIMVD